MFGLFCGFCKTVKDKSFESKSVFPHEGSVCLPSFVPPARTNRLEQQGLATRLSSKTIARQRRKLRPLRKRINNEDTRSVTVCLLGLRFSLTRWWCPLGTKVNLSFVASFGAEMIDLVCSPSLSCCHYHCLAAVIDQLFRSSENGLGLAAAQGFVFTCP